MEPQHDARGVRWMNGVDARAGGYLEEPAPARHFAALARGVRLDRGGARALRAAKTAGQTRRGLKEGLDPARLADAADRGRAGGWD